MSRISSAGIIELNRGDSLTFKVLVNTGTNLEPCVHQLNDLDSVYFALMEPNQCFECAILKKKLTQENQDESGNILVTLRPDDTVCLLPGRYYYQLKLAIHPESVVTIVDKTQFFILE